MEKKRIVFIGWGAISTRVAVLLDHRAVPVDIVGIVTTGKMKPRDDVPNGAVLLHDQSQLVALKPDLVVEAAGRGAVEFWAPAVLAAGSTLIVASTSAFCDDALLPRLASIAEEHGARILIPSGAIGGVDALASAAVLGLDRVVHSVVKPPAAWKGTPAEKMLDLDHLSQRAVFFTGTAREAAVHYPQNANATVVTSLAGLGIDKTQVELVADPAVRINQHSIVAEGAFGRMEITLQNNPLATNPKSSELTALSLVRVIENEIGSVVI